MFTGVSVSVLDRPVMSAREAARQLRVPPRTLLSWLQGTTREGTWYAPILRDEPTGDDNMTWGEIVEARYLRAYRTKSVPMWDLRTFVAELRQEFGIPYPLAHNKPWIGPGRRLMRQVQERVDLPQSLWAVWVEATTGQIILSFSANEFWERVDFSEEGEAIQLRPAGRESPVVMRPTLASGAATVRGIRTEVLVEQANADVPVEEIAEDFGLRPEDVKAALSYEWSLTA